MFPSTLLVLITPDFLPTDSMRSGWNDAKCNSKAGYVCQRPIIEAVHEQQTLTFDADCNSGVSADALQSLLLGNADVQLGCGIAANENMAVTGKPSVL